MKAITAFLWKTIVTSTVEQTVRLVRKARARRVFVIGENTDALSYALSNVVEQLEVLNHDGLHSVLARSQTELQEGRSFLSAKDDSFDLCIVNFELHQVDPEVAEQIVRECKRIAPNALLVDFALAERNIELPSQYVCSLAEQFLHRGHWDIYKNYIRVGALHGIAHRAQASEFANKTIWGGGIRLLLVG
ncbi:class I SAM-dependent methyltransferase [Halodesulfovibrio marinisediminis]|uniref:Methyltransferase domain-containing protein n=1 Tax=Halodesulfovibrio marinisediminis DSM 17456 TaxID=1121457 RepID=A0A1N6DN17_9BACT|nr:class I SAM-dependent methyltransferase [Halodesulfovibrio marinisediminis]SIN72150.1 hypothetical protein SAMN02745161_0329 [Halodesulfovibrio marinisediminis DSM 17456]